MSDLKRFIQAQKCYYPTALEEVSRGCRESHWVGYIFPQLKDLGISAQAKEYGINGIDEAREYMADPTLRERIVEISQALLDCG